MNVEPRTQDSLLQGYWHILVERAIQTPQLATQLLAQSRQLLGRFQAWSAWLHRLPRPARRRLQRRLRISLAGAALTLAISQTSLAYAATIPVTTTTPTVAVDTFCSLIEAIINANDDAATNADCVAGSGADTITLNGNSYTLTSPYNALDPVVGLPAITSVVTIAGAGATIERDSSADSFGILHVASSGDLTLEQTTITGGEATTGGGLYNEGTATLLNSTVTTNTAYFGGGILNTGIMTLTNSTVSTNSAAYLGGGILNDNTLTLVNSTVSGNASLTVGGGVFNYNSAYEAPGAAPKKRANVTRWQQHSPKQPVAQAQQDELAAMTSGDLTLIDSAVTGNTAYIHGGGIFNVGGAVTLTASNVTTNTATTCCGGGIYNYYGSLILTDSTIAANVANYNGGGIFNSYGSVTLTDSTVAANSAVTYDGGGIYNQGWEEGGDLTLTHSTITGNSAGDSGGGISSLYGALLLQDDSSVTNNQSTEDGGGINSYDDTLTIIDSSVSNNSSGEDGGGIDAFYSIVTISNSTISSNSAVEDGGGMDPDESTVTIENSTFHDNSAGYSGGALFFDSGTLTVTQSTISNNSAELDGGGIGLSTATAILNNSTVSGNEATGNGGGLIAYGTDVDLRIYNSTIAVNRAGDQGGGLFTLNGALATLVKTLIAGNSATNGGNEVHNDSSTITADAQNLLGESSESTAQAFTSFTPGGTDLTATSDGTIATPLANILNPTLADNGGNTLTHALVSGSPAIDAAGDSALSTDQRGVARPQGTADDIGAVEVKALNGPSGSVVQTSVTSVYNGTPQSCPATGGTSPIQTITPTFLNSSSQTFTDLFFRVKTLEYTTSQGGLVPSLCNATSAVDNGGVGSMLAIANTSLPGGNNAYDPTESFSQIFQVGLPIRAQFRIKIDLFSSTAGVASANGALERHIGSFDLIIDPTAEESTMTETVFLPIVTSQP